MSGPINRQLASFAFWRKYFSQLNLSLEATRAQSTRSSKPGIVRTSEEGNRPPNEIPDIGQRVDGQPLLRVLQERDCFRNIACRWLLCGFRLIAECGRIIGCERR